MTNIPGYQTDVGSLGGPGMISKPYRSSLIDHRANQIYTSRKNTSDGFKEFRGPLIYFENSVCYKIQNSTGEILFEILQ